MKDENTNSYIQKTQDSLDDVVKVKAEELTEDKDSKDMPGTNGVEPPKTDACTLSHVEASPKVESKNDTTPKDSCCNNSATCDSKRLRSQSPQTVRGSKSPTHERSQSHGQKPSGDNPHRSSQFSPSRSSQREKSQSKTKSDHRSDSKQSRTSSRRKTSMSPSSSRTSSRESSRNRRSPSHRSSSSRYANSSTNRIGKNDRSAAPKNKHEHKGFPSEKSRSPKKAVAIVPPRKRSPVE